MNIQKCKTLLKEDYKRLPIRSKNKFKNLILNGVFSESFNVTLWFRLGNYFIEQKGIVNKILGAFCRLMLLHKGHKYGISLKLGNQIGGGYFYPSLLLYNNISLCSNRKKFYSLSRRYYRTCS